MSYQIIVCGGLAPDPLQTLEPVPGPALKNELMLPAVFDPWAAHALYEAANLAKNTPGATIKVLCMAPKAKLQQVMMTVAQKLPFELIPLDGVVNGFSDAMATADALAAAINAIAGLDKSKLLLFGGWESATRGAGVVMPALAAKLGIAEIFLAVDELAPQTDGSFLVKERVEGGKHMVSRLASPPAVFGWATGNLPEPANHPQTGMANMRAMMPALQRAQAVKLVGGVTFSDVHLPAQTRQTRIVKDVPAAQIAQEIVEWIKE